MMAITAQDPKRLLQAREVANLGGKFYKAVSLAVSAAKLANCEVNTPLLGEYKGAKIDQK